MVYLQAINNSYAMLSSIMKNIFLITLSVFLFFSCSRTNMVNSSFTSSPLTNNKDFPTWMMNASERNNFDGLIHYFANDDEYFYVLTEITNPGFARDAMRYGLTIYFDTDFRRSFGITYPTGLLHGLSDYPGARKGFLESASWENNPENRRLIEMVERNMPDRAMITQRRERREDLRPQTVPTSHLEAQGILLYFDNSGRAPIIGLRVPMKEARNRQFAINAEKGQEIRVGFEVKPPEPEDIEREDTGVASQPRDMRGQNNRQHQRQMEMQRDIRSMLRGGFDYWTNVQIAEE